MSALENLFKTACVGVILLIYIRVKEMRTIIRRLTAIIILFLLFAGAAAASVVYESGGDPAVYASDHGGVISGGRQSSFAYKKYRDHSLYRKALKDKMSDAYGVLEVYMDDIRTIPIPGIIETFATNRSSHVSSDDYVPQGLCKAGDYFLVTAYDAAKDNNSVIYAVDMNERKLVSTLTLPNKYHAGGIAYDGERIWLTGDTSDKYEGKPFVQYIDYDVFANMVREPLHRITDSEISGKVYIKNKPSFLECNNGVLWVGTYAGSRGTHQGYMNGYPIISGSGRVILDTMMYSVISGIDSSAQGADIFGNYLYVSSSYMGWISEVKTSFVTMYDITDVIRHGEDLDVSEQEIRRVEVPKMNEEILVDQGIMYINFESAYDGWPAPVIRTDRILAVRRNLWR